MLMPDSASYDLPARAWLETGRFAVSPQQPDVPMVVRTPGYPAFIALIYTIFGRSHVAVIAVQIMISVLTIGTAALLAHRLWGPVPALVSASLLALDPVGIMSSQLLLSETLFTFFLVASAGTFVAAATGAYRCAWTVGLGLLIPLAALTRPIAYYLVWLVPPGIVLWGWLAGWTRRETVATVLLTAVPSFMPIVGWQLRNYHVCGHSGFSQITNVNLVVYRAAGIIAQREKISLAEAQDKLERKHRIQDTYETPAERWVAAGQDAGTLICQHPGLFAKDLVRGAVWVLFQPASRGLLDYLGLDAGCADTSGNLHAQAGFGYVWKRLKELLAHPAFAVAFCIESVYLLITYVGSGYGLWRLMREGRRPNMIHWCFAFIVIYLLLLSSGPESNNRFRGPIMPFLALYAGGGLTLLLRRRKADRQADDRASRAYGEQRSS